MEVIKHIGGWMFIKGMDLRTFISKLEVEGSLVKIVREVSVKYEAARILAALDGRPVYFKKVRESEIQ